MQTHSQGVRLLLCRLSVQGLSRAEKTGLPLGKHVEIEPYYEHQNNTGKSPNQRLNQLGLIPGLYF
jgi:hypothetical protein